MKWLLLTLSLFAASAEAQIFRCETQTGTVFSDTPCSADSEVIVVDNISSGISGGISEEASAQLEQKKEQRAEERQQARELRASQPQQPIYVQVPQEETVIYPGLWPWRPGNRPHPRPPRPQPKPEQSSRPPMLLPGVGGSLIQNPKR